MSRKHYFMQSSKKEASDGKSTEVVVNRFSDIQKVDERRHNVLDYMIMGYDEFEIADYLNESVETIRNDAAKIMEVGYKARDEDIEEVRDEIMRTYRMAKKEAFRAFKQSQGEVVKTTKETGETGKGSIDKTKVQTETMAGDPRFLNVMIDASKEMGKVSGAQKHREVQVQNNIQNNTMRILSPDRTEMPPDFDRWTKKPEGVEVPTAEGIESEDL